MNILVWLSTYKWELAGTSLMNWFGNLCCMLLMMLLCISQSLTFTKSNGMPFFFFQDGSMLAIEFQWWAPKLYFSTRKSWVVGKDRWWEKGKKNIDYSPTMFILVYLEGSQLKDLLWLGSIGIAAEKCFYEFFVWMIWKIIKRWEPFFPP